MKKPSLHNPRKHGHNHDEMHNPVTGKLYWPGCPACEMNVEFIKIITRPGCTQEEWEAAAQTLKDAQANRKA